MLRYQMLNDRNKFSCLRLMLTITLLLSPAVSCTTTDTYISTDRAFADLTGNCSAIEIVGEPEWVFLKCEVKNGSDQIRFVSFSPHVVDEDPYFIQPEAKELEGLQKRLTDRVRPAAPLLPQTPTGDRPEAFVLQAVANILSFALKTSPSVPRLQNQSTLEMKPDSVSVVTFPLIRASQQLPKSVPFDFTLPAPGRFFLPLHDGAETARRRPPLRPQN